MAKTCLKKKQNIPAIKASFLPRHVAQQDWIFKIIRRGQPLTGNHSNREGNQQETLEKNPNTHPASHGPKTYFFSFCLGTAKRLLFFYADFTGKTMVKRSPSLIIALQLSFQIILVTETTNYLEIQTTSGYSVRSCLD